MDIALLQEAVSVRSDRSDVNAIGVPEHACGSREQMIPRIGSIARDIKMPLRRNLSAFLVP
ncbi:hypothetical protein MesoLj131a_11340 [Mesorhizobium sp. 131-2-1]|nr:hypothetical protein MesoLj131a_11340 [Mesorhizobium sp. 131-2-1]